MWRASRLRSGHTALDAPEAQGRITMPSNNAMQLTRGGWRRVEASSSARIIMNQGEVLRPSQLIASVGLTEMEEG
jgi:hypothetical protein